MAVNMPRWGADNLIVVATGVCEPRAQFGTHRWTLEIPVPAAPVAVHDDQLIPVTIFPPSPEKPMTEGLTPRYPSVGTNSTGRDPPLREPEEVPVTVAAGLSAAGDTLRPGPQPVMATAAAAASAAAAR